MSFKPGDRVRDNFDRTGTVIAEPAAERLEFIAVDYDGGSGGWYAADELTLETPKFVNVVTSRTIWVTLPGDNAGHRLTEDEAQTLFRQLEEVI